MIPLYLSIFSSTIIFVLFKLFKKYQIDTFQAIVFNYFTAAICGIGLYHEEWSSKAMESPSWIPFVFISAALFIGLFFLMGESTQENGVASTSIAVKMSMAISLLLIIIAYSEKLTLLKVLGICMAFIGVYLVSINSQKNKINSNSKWMLVFLFFGSGTLDFTLNYVQNNELNHLSSSLFSAFGLGLAGVFGSVILLINVFRGKAKIKLQNIIAGIVLGIPNYFSIYLLMLSYHSTGWDDSTVLAVTNVGVVLVSAIIGFTFFKENATKRKIFGLAAAIISILILSISN